MVKGIEGCSGLHKVQSKAAGDAPAGMTSSGERLQLLVEEQPISAPAPLSKACPGASWLSPLNAADDHPQHTSTSTPPARSDSSSMPTTTTSAFCGYHHHLLPALLFMMPVTTVFCTDGSPRNCPFPMTGFGGGKQSALPVGAVTPVARHECMFRAAGATGGNASDALAGTPAADAGAVALHGAPGAGVLCRVCASGTAHAAHQVADCGLVYARSHSCCESSKPAASALLVEVCLSVATCMMLLT